MVKAIATDPVFANEWKDALVIAKAVTDNLDAMKRVQIAPRSSTKLVEVDGVQIPSMADMGPGDGSFIEGKMFRMPMHGTVASLFAEQLRVVELKDKTTISKFEETYGACKDTQWALTKESKETGPQTVAMVHGRCAKVEGRGGWNHVRTVELVVFDQSGKAVLVVG